MDPRDAITSTAIARRETRNAVERLDYHLSRGVKGAKGVAREIEVIDALHRQSVRLAGATVGGNYRVPDLRRGGLTYGQKAAQALASGNSAQIGRMKSSILADFTADSLQPIRDQAPQQELGWRWAANATACPFCLAMHGRQFPPGSAFEQLHPSCMCIPLNVNTPGLRRLTREELVDTSGKYGSPRNRSLTDKIARGDVDIDNLPNLAVNRQLEGLNAARDHSYYLDQEGQIVRAVEGGPAQARIDPTTGKLRQASPDLGDKDTFTYYTDDAGNWTADRAALHDDIVKKFLDDVEVVGPGGEFHMMGGGPASGKSSMLRSDNVKLPRGNKAVQIDPDEIKKLLPDYAKLADNLDTRAATFGHEESSYLAKRILKEAAEKQQNNIVLDGVGDGGWESVMKKILKAREEGYSVNANYATLPTEKAVRLSKIRGQKTGRNVPETYLREAHADVSDTFFDVMLRGGWDDAALWDTDNLDEIISVFKWRNGAYEIGDDKALQLFLDKGTRGRTIESLKLELDDYIRATAKAKGDDFGEVVYKATAEGRRDAAIAKSALDDAAKAAGTTADDVLAAYQKLIDEAPLKINMTERALEGTLRDGRYKTQYEVGSTTATETRAAFLGDQTTIARTYEERRMFGYADDLPVAERPVYGSLGNTFDGNAPNFITSSYADAYGDVTVVMKDSIRKWTTVSLDDSLSRPLVPAPIDKINAGAGEWQTVVKNRQKGVADNYLKTPSLDAAENPWMGIYPEVQFHNGSTTTSQFEKVVFKKEPNFDTKTLLEEQGIPWEIFKPPEIPFVPTPKDAFGFLSG